MQFSQPPKKTTHVVSRSMRCMCKPCHIMSEQITHLLSTAAATAKAAALAVAVAVAALAGLEAARAVAVATRRSARQ